MTTRTLDLVFIGLSITSSWGNGHATTYRALVKALARQGHRITFLERDVPWYREHRDDAAPEGCTVHLYDDLEGLQRHEELVRNADAVIVGSYVPQGVEVGRWVIHRARGVTAFYDIDTPVTLAKLSRGDHEYLDPWLVKAYEVYLSFTGGPLLDRLEWVHGARRAVPLYCSVDPEKYTPVDVPRRYGLGYLGTWSADRQPKVDALLLEVARARPSDTFAIGGPCYPDTDRWPANVVHRPHVPPGEHAAFYCAQRFTLNVTRQDMVASGYSPSVRLFEAAACGVPIVSDRWSGLELLFEPDEEILLVRSTEDVLGVLDGVDDERRDRIGAAARRRVLGAHTASHRAAQLVRYLRTSEARGGTAIERYATARSR